MIHQAASTPTTSLGSLHECIRDSLESLEEVCAEKLAAWRSTHTAEELAALERDIHATFRAAADEVTQAVLTDIVTDEAFQQETNEAVRASGKRYCNGGRRTVKVTLLGGSTIEVKVPYLHPDISRQPGPKRGQGRRGKGGAGLYPALVALRIWFGVTPTVANEVCKQLAASDSVRARFLGEAATPPRYALVDLGPFPAMIAGGETAVIGEVYAVDDKTLARLDILEGHPRFYQRQRIQLASGQEVEAYLMAPGRVAGRPRIPSGDWRTR